MDLQPIRTGTRPGSLAVLGAAPADLLAALAAVDLPVGGALADAFGPPVQGERFGSALEVLAAAEAGRVDAALVAPEAAPLLPDLVAAGLPVLLTAAAPWDVDLLQALRPAVEDVPLGVLLRTRTLGWARAADAALHDTAGQPPTQVVVQGWPRGQDAAAGLVDLLLRWCGDAVAVCAAPAALPAARLPDGEPVAWALLTGTGCTVLLAHGGAVPQVRLSFPDRRLLAGPDGVRWADGGPVPRVGPDLGVLGARPGADPAWTGAEQLAQALVAALDSGTTEALGSSVVPWPWPADVVDLLPVARVLAALEASARTGTWVELG